LKTSQSPANEVGPTTTEPPIIAHDIMGGKSKRGRTKSSPNDGSNSKNSEKRQCQTTMEEFVEIRRDLTENFEELSVSVNGGENEGGENGQVAKQRLDVNNWENGNNWEKAKNGNQNCVAQMDEAIDSCDSGTQSLQHASVMPDLSSAIQSVSEELKSHRSLLHQILDHQDTFKKSMETFERRITDQNKHITDLENRMVVLEKYKTDAPQHSNASDMAFLEEEINRLERKQRERNIRVIGVQEQYRENCMQIVENIVQGQLRVNAKIEVAHRTGPNNEPRRHIIARVSSVQEKIDIFKAQRYSGTFPNVVFTDDLTSRDYKRKRAYKPQIDQARRDKKRWQFRNGWLFIEGQRIELNNQLEDQYRTDHQQQYGNERPVAVSGHSTVAPPPTDGYQRVESSSTDGSTDGSQVSQTLVTYAEVHAEENPSGRLSTHQSPSNPGYTQPQSDIVQQQPVSTVPWHPPPNRVRQPPPARQLPSRQPPPRQPLPRHPPPRQPLPRQPLSRQPPPRQPPPRQPPPRQPPPQQQPPRQPPPQQQPSRQPPPQQQPPRQPQPQQLLPIPPPQNAWQPSSAQTVPQQTPPGQGPGLRQHGPSTQTSVQKPPEQRQHQQCYAPTPVSNLSPFSPEFQSSASLHRTENPGPDVCEQYTPVSAQPQPRLYQRA